MKRIVFAEGKYDVLLLRKVLETCSGSVEVTNFIGEDVVSSIGGEESRAVRSFIERRNPYHLLLKSEGGKSDLKRLFAQLMPELYNEEVAYNLLIDLDGGSFQGIQSEINERCESYTVDIAVEVNECTTSNAHLLGYNCSVNLNGETRDSFNAVGFTHSMETSAGIEKDQDNDEKREKIHRLSRNDSVTEPIKDLLF